MKIFILTGIVDELNLLFDMHSFDYRTDIRMYRSKEHPAIYAGCSGPGLGRRNELQKFLDAVKPDIILNAGLVGILNLNDTAKTGDPLRLNTVIESSEDLIFPGGPGSDTLVTVDLPVLEPYEKMKIYYEYYRARAFDMEAGKLLRFVGGLNSVSSTATIIFCKTVGEFAEQSEKQSTVWSFAGPPFSIKKLKKAREIALKGLTEQVNRKIIRLLETGGIPNDMDSVFIPH